MKVLEEICEILEGELDEIARKNNITASELDHVDKAVDIIKDIKTIHAMDKEYGDRRSSFGYEYDASGRYMPYMHRENDYDGYYSERRGRDAMGRYTSRGYGYSRDDEKEQLRKQMEEMQKKLDRM